MAELFIYDSAHVLYKLQADGTIPPGADLVKFKEPIRQLGQTLPDYLLARTLMDINRDNFGGLQKFLSDILLNGHDRTDTNDFGKHLGPLEIKALQEKGYKGSDIFWAKPIQRTKPELYDLANRDELTTAYLVFDGRAYEELSPQVYGQKDVARRQAALLAIIMFVREGKKPQPRDDLRFQLKLELDTRIIEKIQQKCYPT